MIFNIDDQLKTVRKQLRMSVIVIRTIRSA